MSPDNRKSRQLSLSGDYPEKNDTDLLSAPVIDEFIAREELKKLYKGEIDSLVAEQLEVSKKLYMEAFVKKNEELLSSKLKKLNDQERDYAASIEAIKTLAISVEQLYQAKVDKDIHGLDAVIVPIVMEALYKILGDTKVYKKTVVKIVGECLDGYRAHSPVKIRMSENDYNLVKTEFESEATAKCLFADKRLTDGQCVLDDGISLYETGLLDQLDNLRMIFIAKLRENHGL